MSSLNSVTIIGNLGQDADVKYMPSGDAVANISIATSEKWKDKDSGEPRERTEWHRCTLFKRQAEVVAQFAKKGSKVCVQGKLRTRKWEKDGQMHYSTEIHVDNLVLLDRKQDGEQAARPTSSPPKGKPAAATTAAAGDDDFGDEIPF